MEPKSLTLCELSDDNLRAVTGGDDEGSGDVAPAMFVSDDFNDAVNRCRAQIRTNQDAGWGIFSTILSPACWRSVNDW
jgi:hypothetical protein